MGAGIGAGKDDSLEARLAADEAAISDDGFSALVVAQARSRSRFRRSWLTAAAMIGGGAAAFSLGAAAPVIGQAFSDAAPAQLMISLPAMNFTLQLTGGTFLGLALAMAMLVGAAAARFAGDDI